MFKHLFLTRQFGCALLLLLTIFLGACDGAKQADILRIGTNIWPGYEPLYLAASLDYFDSEQIRLIEYSSASQVVRAFRNDVIDAAALTIDEALQLAQYGFDLEIVLVMDISNGGDVILARPGLTDMMALKNQRVGVENTALGAYLMSRALQLNGMSISDVKVVSLEVGEHESAYLSGEIDAAVTFDPVRSRMLNAGAIPVFDSRQIPGEIVDVLVIRNNYIPGNEKAITMLIDGWYRSLSYMKSQPEKAMNKISERLHLSSMQTLESYNGLLLPDKNENKQLLLHKPQPILLESLQRMHKIMLERNLLSHSVDIDLLFDYIEKHPELHQ